MIRYALKCVVEHEFEAWFSSSSGFDEQVTQGLVECPMCGSRAVTKAIMAPQVHTSNGADSVNDARKAVAEAQKLAEIAHRLRQQVESTHDYVGPSFAAEARDMHEGTTPERPIYGEATRDEVKALVEDGVPVAPLPVFNTPLDDGAAPKALPPKPRGRGQGKRLN